MRLQVCLFDHLMNHGKYSFGQTNFYVNFIFFYPYLFVVIYKRNLKNQYHTICSHPFSNKKDIDNTQMKYFIYI